VKTYTLSLASSEDPSRNFTLVLEESDIADALVEQLREWLGHHDQGAGPNGSCFLNPGKSPPLHRASPAPNSRDPQLDRNSKEPNGPLSPTLKPLPAEGPVRRRSAAVLASAKLDCYSAPPALPHGH
jgi:hypothetical protein